MLCQGASNRALDLCHGCESDLIKNSCSCIQCGVPLDPLYGENKVIRCGNCLARPPSFQRCIAPFIYDFPVNDLILQYKNTGQRAVGKMLATLLAQHIKNATVTESLPVEFIKPDYLLPVPMQKSKLRKRGFDQAHEISLVLSKYLNIPIMANNAFCQTTTKDQKGLSAIQRKQNLQDRFAFRYPVQAKSVAIVDDVVTTGATAEALSKQLNKQGVSHISVWCLARTPLTI